MSSATWRQFAQRVIIQVEREHEGKSLAELKRALRNAYPFGQRQYHPYKIWCDEQSKAIARHPESQTTDGLPLFDATPAGAGKDE